MRSLNPVMLAVAVWLSAGDWITRPDGTPVCQLDRDVYADNGSILTSRFWRSVCSSWAESAPQTGAPMPSWIRGGGGSVQVHVGNNWK